MMHGREKSDSAIVAGKPTNKAGQLAAEPVEPRAEAKGNASQQRTRRTQSRVSVSHALERIRQTGTKRTLCRHTPKVGAVCPNWARTDLCGGREVTRVPTAISEMSSRKPDPSSSRGWISNAKPLQAPPHPAPLIGAESVRRAHLAGSRACQRGSSQG
jgi:hypothetical protein